MASTFTTGFGIEKIGSGEQSGAWGTTTNHNLDILDRIASYKAVALSGTTHTLTVREASPGSGTENLQDGMYRVIKFTGALGANNTVTIAPNTAPAYFIFENATTDSASSGPYSVILTQGSGANITIQNGKNAIVYCDGAGSGAAVVNALSDLQIATLEVTGVAALDGAVTVGGASQFNSTVTVGVDDTGYDVKFFGATSGAHMLWDESADDLKLVGAAGLTVAGNIDVDGTTNLDAVDIDGAVQIDNTVTVGVDDTGYDVKFFGATSGSHMLWDESADDLKLVGAAGLTVAGGITVTSGTTSVGTGGVTIDATAAADANPELELTAVARQFNIGVGGATFATTAIRGSYYIYDATATAYRFSINSSGNVGIGTEAPVGLLQIGAPGGSWNGAANGRDLTVHGGSETTTGVGQISVQATDAFGVNLGGGISFGGEYSAGDNIDWATLWGRKENATDDNTAGYMQFNTRVNGGNMTERMRITSAGLALVNKSTTQTANAPLQVASSLAAGQIFVGNTSGTGWMFGRDNVSTGNFVLGEVTNDADTSVSNLLTITTGTGNVGIGTTAPASLLEVKAAALNRANGISLRGSGANDVLYIYPSANDAATIEHLIDGSTSTGGILAINPQGGAVGICNPGSGVVSGYLFNASGFLQHSRASGAAQSMTGFYNGGSLVGEIRTSTTATAYITSSDYRLKEEVIPMTNALAKVAQLKPRTYKWKLNGEAAQGFIAHELQEVVPEAVAGVKDELDEDGKPKYQGVDTSFLVATLTAAMQEQQATIEALTNRITALEG